MSSWFGENNLRPENESNNTDEHTKPETNDESESSSFKADGPAPNADSNNMQDDQKGNTGWTAGDNKPPAEDCTYHYGINAQNKVPESTNRYTQQSPYSNQQGGYFQQGGYNQYNWQQVPPPGMPPNKPPKKKKRGAAIAIATLSVVCAAAIITLSVLLAMALTQNRVPIGNSSDINSSAKGGANVSGPVLEIVEEDEDAKGLSTPSIVQMNLDSTVAITLWARQGSLGFGGGSQIAQVGAASGIIMSADGYIITNWHVVTNEDGRAFDRIDVKTYDGTVYENAEVVGADQDTDLAVIKVGAAKLSPAQFGDSSGLKLGDKIVAIGNAGGLSWTTTEGIVSGLARDVYEDTGYAIKCLQVDAAINPGNSGGPLLNSQGQVVGINSAKISAPAYEGIGFSIPIKEAKVIIDDLIEYGYVKNRVMLGVTVRDITQPGYEGCQIEEINQDSCLAGTSARPGDIITGIDDARVKNGRELRSELSKHKVGDKIKLSFIRVDMRTGAKSNFTVTCTLKEHRGQ